MNKMSFNKLTIFKITALCIFFDINSGWAASDKLDIPVKTTPFMQVDSDNQTNQRAVTQKINGDNAIDKQNFEINKKERNEITSQLKKYAVRDNITNEYYIDIDGSKGRELAEKALSLVGKSPDEQNIEKNETNRSQSPKLITQLFGKEVKQCGGTILPVQLHAYNDFPFNGKRKYRFTLFKNGSKVSKKEKIITCSDPFPYACPFPWRFIFDVYDSGTYKIQQKVFRKIIGIWVRIKKLNSQSYAIATKQGVSECPRGHYDSVNCKVANPPWGTSGFVYKGALYYTSIPNCPLGSYDGANCFIGKPLTKPFKYQGNIYYPPYSGNSCPIPGTSYDGANCFSAPASMKPFIYNGGLYVQPIKGADCPLTDSYYDGANCFTYRPPSGSKSFIYKGAMYYTPVCK